MISLFYYRSLIMIDPISSPREVSDNIIKYLTKVQKPSRNIKITTAALIVFGLFASYIGIICLGKLYMQKYVIPVERPQLKLERAQLANNNCDLSRNAPKFGGLIYCVSRGNPIGENRHEDINRILHYFNIIEKMSMFDYVEAVLKGGIFV